MAVASVYTAEFQRPRSVPGYGGFTPTVQFSNGCTYGAASRRFYESSKLEELSSSVIRSQRKNNYFTTPKSRPGSGHNPKYTLSHTGGRRMEVLRFDNDAQTHRQHYKDHTGTFPRVPSFIHRRIASAPTTRMDIWLALAGTHLFYEQLLPLASTYDRSLLYSNRARPNNGLVSTRRTNALERATRDQFFQRR